MFGEVILLNVEFITVCVLGFLGAILLIILTVLIICKLKQRSSQDREEVESASDFETESEPLIKKRKLTTVASNLISGQTAFHFKNNAFILQNNVDSKINFSLLFREETEKIVLQMKDIIIGGKTECIKPHLSELHQIYFRIALNNNTSNSTIMSELYKFNSKVIVEENFLFSMKETQLKGTSVFIEVFVILTNNASDLLLGWVEVDLPTDITQYPLKDNPSLREVSKPIDLYLNPVGYVCIILTSLQDKIKVTLFATNFNLEKLDNKGNKESVVFFTLQIKNTQDLKFGHTCKTTMKVPLTTIGWNEVFNFDVANDLKENSYINIEFLRSFGQIGTPIDQPTTMGSLNIGLSEQCQQKSQTHWKYILENESVDCTKWHPICAVK